MDKKTISNTFILLIFFLNGCFPSKNEEKILYEFNSKYDGEFHFFVGANENYLKVQVVNKLDSARLEDVYDEIFSRGESTSVKEEPIRWVYLVVYNNRKQYLFTMIKEVGSNRFKYFSSGID